MDFGSTNRTSTRRTERLAESGKQKLRLARVRPEEPRGAKFLDGVVSWEEPKETSNVTHYNIYLDLETNLVQRVPQGQVTVAGLSGERVFISSYNELSGLESIKILLDQQIGSPDKDVPPKPTALVSNRPGYLVLTYPSFIDLVNVATISSATWTIYYFDESAPVKSQLDGAITDTSTATILDSVALFSVGDYALIEGEIVFVAAVDSGTNTLTISRGQLASVADSHADDKNIYRLNSLQVITPLEASLIGSPEWSTWEYAVPMRFARVVGFDLFVSNARGNSPAADTVNYSSVLSEFGIRILSGAQHTLFVDGILGVQSDPCPPLYMGQSVSVRDIYAEVKQEPVGADITVEVKKDGDLITTLTIVDGDTVSDVYDGLDQDPIGAAEKITISITGTGTTYPGERLSVFLRL